MNQFAADKLKQQGGSLCLEDWASAWADQETKLRGTGYLSFPGLKASLLAEATAAIRSGELPIRSALTGKERPFREDDNTELARCRVRILPTSIDHWLSCQGLTPFDVAPAGAATPDSPTLLAEPDNSPSPTFAAAVTHRLVSTRSAALAAEINEAKRTAPDPTQWKSVWGELTKLAGVRFGTLVGHSSDGVNYEGEKFNESGEYDVLTRKNLKDRMWREKRDALKLAGARCDSL